MFFISLILFSAAFSFHTSSATWLGMEVERDQLLVGKDSFNMVNPEGIKIGSMVIQGEFTESDYNWDDISILDGIVSEEASYSFDKNTLRLHSSSVDYTQGNTNVSLLLAWDNGHITGDYTMRNADKRRDIVIDTTRVGAVDRAEVFAFIQALPLNRGLSFPITVFAQPGGEFWEMQVEVVGEAKCTVPAGEFDTYKINFTGDKLSNVIYVSKNAPRKMVKVEVVGQPLTIELVSSKRY